MKLSNKKLVPFKETSSLRQRIQELEYSQSDYRREIEECKASLKDSLSRYNNLIEQSRSIILEWDTDGNILFMNTWGLEFFGFSKEELFGRNVVGTIVPPVDNRGEDLVAKMISVQRTPDAFDSSENENMRKNGERIWISWTNKGIVNDDGKVVRTLSIGMDRTKQRQSELALIRYREGLEAEILERTRELQTTVASRNRELEELKRIQEDLRQSEEKFRLAFMTGLDAYYWATLEEGRIIEINPVFENLFGYPRAEVIGKNSLELNLYYDPADRAKMVSELKAKGFVKDLELKGRKKDGKVITISFSASMMRRNSQSHILGVLRDIPSARRRRSRAC